MIKQVFFKMLSRFHTDEIAGYAAQISFYLLLSIFPFLILLAFLLTRIPVINLEDVFDFLYAYDAFPEEALALIDEVFHQLVIPKGTLSALLIIALWCSARGIRAIMNGVHMSFRTRESRGVILKFLRSFFYTLMFAIMLILFLVLVLFGDFLLGWIQETFGFVLPTIFDLARYLLPPVFLFILYLLLYRSIPSIRLRFRDVYIGAVFSTLASFVVSKGFSIYTTNFANYTALYGSISSIIVICTWMYLFSFVLILGAELNAVLYEVKNDTTLIQ